MKALAGRLPVMAVAAAFVMLMSCTADIAGSAVNEGAPLQWELVWHDEFDYSGLPDPEKWGYQTGGHGWGNLELQHYTDDRNAVANGGTLKIELRKEQAGWRDYSSARMYSVAGFTYGRFEVSAKVPKGLGTWPAVWMLPAEYLTEEGYSQIPWPGCGEIDIMEHVGHGQGHIHQTVHTQKYNGMWGTQKGGSKYVQGVSEDFQVYALEWLPDGLSFFTNGELVFRYEPDDVDDPDEWPFNVPFSIIMNIAYGGNWGGQKGLDDGALPAVMEVDYVRAYRLADGPR